VDSKERHNKESILVAAEMEAAARCQINEGAGELVAFLRKAGIPMAIITRNSRAAVERATANLSGIDLADFSVVVTRDLPLSPKPLPDGCVLWLESWGHSRPVADDRGPLL
jgi:beta-phosphoglucomutase-like phosphatase (HAD superfamily)